MNDSTGTGYAGWMVAELCDHLEQHHHVQIRDLFPELSVQSRASVRVDGAGLPAVQQIAERLPALESAFAQYLLFDYHVLLPFLRYRGRNESSDVSQLSDHKTARFIQRMKQRQSELLQLLDEFRTITGGYEAPVDASPSAKLLYQGLRELDHAGREWFLIEKEFILSKAGLLELPVINEPAGHHTSKPQSMKPILVCTDFSDGSDNAVRYAAQLAQTFQTELIVFHASHNSVSATAAESEGDAKKREAEALRCLQVTADWVKTETGMTVRTQCTTGLPVEAIMTAAREADAGMIVTGARETAAGSGLVGGLVYDLMHASSLPVMAVPIGIKFIPYRKIVLASDLQRGEQFDDAVLRSMLNTFNAQLLLVSVLRPGEKPGVERAIAGVELEHRYSDLTRRLLLTEDESLVDGLNEFAFNQDADLVVIIPHRHNFLVRMMRATQTQKVLKGTHRPLLTLVGN